MTQTAPPRVRYLGSPIPGVELYDVIDQFGALAGPLPWRFAAFEASYLAMAHPSYDIEIVAARR